ncbi:MAG: hypothetical protein AB1778_01075 [Candidatus Bipolaricaulota bacterium]
MRAFRCLVWLEFRRSGVWAAALLGSLAFWAWGLFQVRAVDVAQQLGIRLLLLGIAGAIGALVLALMVGRLRGDTRAGLFQMLLMTPPTGYVHVGTRYAFAAATAALYYMGLGGLAWWTLRLSGLPLDAGTVAQLALGLPFYALGVSVIPLLAWTLLLVTFQSAYRVSGTGWIPGTVMALGTPFALRWLVNGIERVAYALPGWPVLGSVGADLIEAAQGIAEDPAVSVSLEHPALVLPQEPLWIMLALAVVLLLAAGRIWQEVEA